jgi:flagellar motor switch protein FliM
MFTPTETRIINIMMDVIFSSLKEAWAPVMAVECEHLGSEINPQFVQIADENDLVVACHLDVELSATEKGSIDIVYPFAALKPIRDELRGRVQDSNDNAVDDGIWLNELESAASYAELETVVELGDTQLSLRQFQSLKEGDVVWFKKYDHAQLVIEGVPVFLTEVGTQHGQAAVQVVGSVPIAEKKTEKLQEK